MKEPRRPGAASPYVETTDEGGDEVCWMDRVCPECGGLAEEAPPTRCPRCGGEISAE